MAPLTGSGTYPRPVAAAEVSALVPILLVLGLVAWIFTDASAHAERGEPVTLRVGNLVLESPAAWTAACLLLFVFFVPAYFVSRSA
ncbi:MAG: hypothetical protein JWN31_39 [Frankiales bacterium]|nr:hypothetical protein [Frankiales bacterium]